MTLNVYPIIITELLLLRQLLLRRVIYGLCMLSGSQLPRRRRGCRVAIILSLIPLIIMTTREHRDYRSFLDNKTAPDINKPSFQLCIYPRGIPEEPTAQSLHMAVQILLQNHGYPFPSRRSGERPR